jgi:hypothetical protein
MSDPLVHHTSGTTFVRWNDELMQATVSRVREASDGTIKAEVRWVTWANGQNEHILTERLNLLSGQAKKRMADELYERVKICDWRPVVEQLAEIVLEHHRVGEPVREICPWEEPVPPDFLIYPLWPRLHPTILFGLGGTAKSLLALTMGMAVQLPWTDNHLGWRVSQTSTKVLYLDWESGPEEIHWRLRCLFKGLDLDDAQMPLGYRRCALPLADDIDRIEEAVAEGEYKAVIVDSIGPACGGNLNDPESALRLFAAVRRLNISSLLIAHTAKGQTNENHKATPFGSAFFTNLARSVWEVQLVQEAGEDSITVGLHHRKTNITRLQRARAYQIWFHDDSTAITMIDAEEIPELKAKMDKTQQITLTLKRGARTVRELKEELGFTENSIKSLLHKLLAKHRVIQVGKSGKETLWGLASNIDDKQAAPSDLLTKSVTGNGW